MKLRSVTGLQINEHFQLRTKSISDLSEAIKLVSVSVMLSDPPAAKVLLAIARQINGEMRVDGILLAQIRTALLCMPKPFTLEMSTEINLLTHNHAISDTR